MANRRREYPMAWLNSSYLDAVSRVIDEPASEVVEHAPAQALGPAASRPEPPQRRETRPLRQPPRRGAQSRRPDARGPKGTAK